MSSVVENPEIKATFIRTNVKDQLAAACADVTKAIYSECMVTYAKENYVSAIELRARDLLASELKEMGVADEDIVEVADTKLPPAAHDAMLTMLSPEIVKYCENNVDNFTVASLNILDQHINNILVEREELLDNHEAAVPSLVAELRSELAELLRPLVVGVASDLVPETINKFAAGVAETLAKRKLMALLK